MQALENTDLSALEELPTPRARKGSLPASLAAAETVLAARNAVRGVMRESFLQGGRQDWKPGGAHDYGLSITDACLGWDDTAQLLDKLAAAWRAGSTHAA